MTRIFFCSDSSDKHPPFENNSFFVTYAQSTDDSVQSGTFVAAPFYETRSVSTGWCPSIGGVEPRNTWAGAGTHPLGEQTAQPSRAIHEILIVYIVVTNRRRHLQLGWDLPHVSTCFCRSPQGQRASRSAQRPQETTAGEAGVYWSWFDASWVGKSCSLVHTQ